MTDIDRLARLETALLALGNAVRPDMECEMNRNITAAALLAALRGGRE